MMKSLVCLVVADGSFVGVEIGANKNVALLKDMIKQKKMYPFPADQMRLYVAKKEGSWLRPSDDDIKKLEQGDVPSGLRALMVDENKMHPSACIGKAAFGFPDENDAPDEDIHVLVQVPSEATGGVAGDHSATTMLKEIHDRVVQPKRHRFVHSDMNSSDCKTLLQALSIHVVPVRTVPLGDGASSSPVPHVNMFEWGTRTEDQDRDRYRAYVETNLGSVLTDNELCVL